MVTIEMVLRQIEQGRSHALQVVRGFELEARQFEHVQLGILTQQVECRQAKVAADGDTQTCGLRHFAHQLRHRALRSEEHTSELQSPMRISYAVSCPEKQKKYHIGPTHSTVSKHEHQSPLNY